MRLMTFGVAALLLVLAPAIAAQSLAQVPAEGIAYESFMKLSPDQRRARFDDISLERKALIVRTHVERWLANNRPRLTAFEVRVFEDIVAFITPEVYRAPQDTAVGQREKALRSTMRCRVNPEDVSEATDVLGRSRNRATSTPRWTFMRQADCWVEWLLEGLVEHLPGQEADRAERNIEMARSPGA